jgi:hypothetical protein
VLKQTLAQYSDTNEQEKRNRLMPARGDKDRMTVNFHSLPRLTVKGRWIRVRRYVKGKTVDGQDEQDHKNSSSRR